MYRSHLTFRMILRSKQGSAFFRHSTAGCGFGLLFRAQLLSSAFCRHRLCRLPLSRQLSQIGFALGTGLLRRNPDASGLFGQLCIGQGVSLDIDSRLHRCLRSACGICKFYSRHRG